MLQEKRCTNDGQTSKAINMPKASHLSRCGRGTVKRSDSSINRYMCVCVTVCVCDSDRWIENIRTL